MPNEPIVEVRQYPRRSEASPDAPPQPSRRVERRPEPQQEDGLEGRLDALRREFDQRLSEVALPRKERPAANLVLPERRTPRAVEVIDRPIDAPVIETRRYDRRSMAGDELLLPERRTRPRNNKRSLTQGHYHDYESLEFKVLVTLATDVLRVQGSGYYSVAAQSGTTDDLSSIRGGRKGDIIQIIAGSGHAITVVDSPFEIQLVDSANFVLSSLTTLRLICIGSDIWREVDRGGLLSLALYAHALDNQTLHTDVASMTEATGDLLHRNASAKWDRLASGAANTYVRSTGAASVPAYKVNPVGFTTHIGNPTARGYGGVTMSEGASTIVAALITVVGGTSAAVNVYHAATVTGSTNKLWTTAKTVSNSASPTLYTSFDDATVQDDLTLHVEVTTVTGSVTDIFVTWWLNFD